MEILVMPIDVMPRICDDEGGGAGCMCKDAFDPCYNSCFDACYA